MAAARIFGISLIVTLAALILGFLHGGFDALYLLVVLGVLEVSLSFDNAVINATVLKRMSPFWRQMFLTIGILIAVFGMRLLFPLLIVWATAGVDPVRALELAAEPPPHGALEFPDGSPSYEKLVTSAHPQIAAFGGLFLLMLFLDFLFNDRDIKWLKWIEVPFARVGRLAEVSVVVAAAALVVVGTQLTHSSDERATVLTAGLLGLVSYLIVNSLSQAFRPAGIDDDNDPTEAPVLATGRAGLTLFVYLEVLDAAFSFDGVTGAFAITSDPIVIALGLGLIGSMFVRSITIYLVQQQTLDRFVYLEHGAHWAIGALSVIMLLSIEERYRIHEVVTASVGVVVIGAALGWSVLCNRRAAAAD
ncbi:DUF475 domain-containing protein [Mycobacterium sherrisii]|uniref:DUF475 domain-containing protein n=1 Tax=Mycobacterium sherrisii TaxID=243061 RepID=UPI000A163C3B|nr:DUF475 domain-containing protein [Mycobacterium sherrisii]MCV7029191.1 DUF475 domain-containing protein [Mycobacterium sherrisii]MEC4763303.1 DUF475 domain-containing protein [Mycobacterium sherrisii]ORW76976.1 hypothetical protein AWC25_10650 [Mycobacterium sherrisii]